jgi:hypothetical protein
MLLALVAAVLAAVGVLWPVTSASEYLRKKAFPKCTVAEIPIATALMTAFLIVVGILLPAGNESVASQGLTRGLVAAGLMLVPLGLYWWALQAANYLLAFAAALSAWLRQAFRRTAGGVGAG